MSRYNPQAFPLDAPEAGEFGLVNEGMALRDYFAIHASESDVQFFFSNGSSSRAAARYAFADTMLAERLKA